MLGFLHSLPIGFKVKCTKIFNMVSEVGYIPTPNYATLPHNIVVQPIIRYLISQISQAIVIHISQAVGAVFFSQAIVIWYLLSLSYLSNLSSHNHPLSLKSYLSNLSCHSHLLSLKSLVRYFFSQSIAIRYLLSH